MQQPGAAVERRRLRDFLDPFDIPGDEFIRKYRLNQQLFMDLYDLLQPYMDTLQRVTAISFELQKPAELSFLAAVSFQAVVGNDYVYNMSQPSVSRLVKKFVNFLDIIMEQMTEFPCTSQDREEIKQGKEMETTRLNMRKCSVQLWRCKLNSYKSALPAQEDIIVELLNSTILTDPHAMNHVKDCNEVPAVTIKAECDAEDVVTIQGMAAGRACLQNNPEADTRSLVKEEYDSIVKTEVETDEVTVKQELDVGPTVLQPQSARRSSPSPAQADLDLHPSTSFEVGGAPAQFCTILGQPALRIKTEDDSKENAYNRVLIEHSYDRPESENTSIGVREEMQCRYCIKSPIECDCRTKVDRRRGEKRHKWDYCKYSTKNESDVINCIRTDREEKLYKCERCEYSSYRLQHLKRHMRTHTGYKPYKCEQCEYVTSRLDSLKIHVRTHTGDKPYKCEQCDYKASELSNVKRHKRVHTGDKPHKCKQCEYRASERATLVVHMRTHTGDKPYKCEQCEYRASEQRNLKKHIRIHTGDKPHKCMQCEYSALHVWHLKRHILIHQT